jgi:hypothetical protein
MTEPSCLKYPDTVLPLVATRALDARPRGASRPKVASGGEGPGALRAARDRRTRGTRVLLGTLVRLIQGVAIHAGRADGRLWRLHRPQARPRIRWGRDGKASKQQAGVTKVMEVAHFQ